MRSLRKVTRLWLVFLFCILCHVETGLSAPILNPGNGHFYDRVFADLTWEEAKSAAEALMFNNMLGHLATITSQAETDFLDVNLPDLNGQSFWLGGFQDETAPDFSEPDGGWRWITGEPFVYTNWATNQPNEFLGDPEEFLETRLNENWTWNDLPNNPESDGNGGAGTFNNNGFIVEFSVPEPSTLWLLSMGGLGMFGHFLRRNRTTSSNRM